MRREIKFREWVGYEMCLSPGHEPGDTQVTMFNEELNDSSRIFMQFTGILDKNGKDIYEGDIMQFTDKWEWFKSSYVMFADTEKRKKLQAEYDAEKLETRTVEIPDFYEWGLSGEIQQYWEVVGNIHENSELLT